LAKGIAWIEGGLASTMYNHLLAANDHSCGNGLINSNGFSAITATSNHGSGACVVFADGHVSFVKSSIGNNIWRAIGTISGSEIVNSNLD
jgi:prepilin-type processing-associated H-X9-DG protein